MAEPTREEIGKPVSESLMQRVKAAIGIVMGKAPSEQWMGAGQPLPAIAQETAGRKTDYAVFRNTTINPKTDEGITFAQLRAVAEAYDPLRLVIETRKDQLAGQTWIIKPKDKTKKDDPRAEALVALFACPDGEHEWSDWLRLIMEDLLVIDAVAVYPRKTIGGATYGFEVIDGATIKRVVDDSGRTPIKGVAYQQILKGMPASDFEAGELVYRARNLRSNRFYGYSPVEQVVSTVQIGLNRQMSQLAYFTDGTVPDAFMGVPEGWDIAQIKEWQNYFDALMRGDPNKKRSIRFMAGDMAKTYKETKQPPLKDMFDEWLMRLICYAFSIDPTPFIAQVNRSVAETTREQALQEGLLPLMNWVKNLVNHLLKTYCDAPDMEFCWEEEEVVGAVEQATILGIYVDKGIMDSDEARAKIGMEPRATEGELDGGGAGTDIQATALNGTQISSMLAIVAEVAAKNLPPEAGKAIMTAAFPTTPKDLIDSIFSSLNGFEKPEPVMPPMAPGQGNVPPNAKQPSGAAPKPGEEVPAEEVDEKKKVEKVEVHIHNTIQPPDVFVDVGATTIHATVEGLTKSETIKRGD